MSEPSNKHDFAYGKAWPGVAKLIEKQGELTQVLGKLVMTGGDTDHWSGDLRKMLIEEIADVESALVFFTSENLTKEEREQIGRRAHEKLTIFRGWHDSTAASKSPAISAREAVAWDRDHAASGWRSRAFIGRYDLIVYDDGDWSVRSAGRLLAQGKEENGEAARMKCLKVFECLR